MPIQCTARRMAATGAGHQHISYLWWKNDQTGEEGVSTREQMVSYVEENGPSSVWCADRIAGQPGQWVRVNSSNGTKYVQTVADRSWTNNLLDLPER